VSLCVQLHLTPLHAVVQLRPSLAYLDDAPAGKAPSGARCPGRSSSSSRGTSARRAVAEGRARARPQAQGPGQGRGRGQGRRRVLGPEGEGRGRGEEEGASGAEDSVDEGMEDGEDKEGPVAVEV